MKNDVLIAIREERMRIEAEINELNEELGALDIVLNRNPLEKVPMRRTRGPKEDEKGTYTPSEQRIIDALYEIGEDSTAKEIYDHLCNKLPNQNKKRLKSSVRQFASLLAKDGRITVQKKEGKLGNVYGIKIRKEPEGS